MPVCLGYHANPLSLIVMPNIFVLTMSYGVGKSSTNRYLTRLAFTWFWFVKLATQPWTVKLWNCGHSPGTHVCLFSPFQISSLTTSSISSSSLLLQREIPSLHCLICCTYSICPISPGQVLGPPGANMGLCVRHYCLFVRFLVPVRPCICPCVISDMLYTQYLT